LGNQSYNVRLKALNEHSLESRRIRADLIMCYKMLHGLVDIDCSMFFKLADSSVTRGHQFELSKPLCPSAFIRVVTLRAKHSGAVYCNRSCLWRKDGRTPGGRAGGVCYHDNSKLRASIFTKLGL